MFRIWPSFARKNFFMVFSYRTGRGFGIHVPVPLFIVDSVIEPLSLLFGFGLGRGLVPARVAGWLPYLGAVGLGGRSLGEMWKTLRWRGSFTLVDVDMEQNKFSIRFV